MNLSNIIKQYRSDHSITMDELARKSGLSKGYISMLEKNCNPRNGKPIIPTLTSLKKLSIGMGIELDKIMTLLDSDQAIDLAPSSSEQLENAHKIKSKGVKIPVLGKVAAGVPIHAVEEIIDYEEIPESLSKTGEFFGLQIKGDSMEPKFSDGDVVIVKKQEDAENGNIVIATINGDDATCKRLMKYQEGIALVSNNPVYSPLHFTNKEIEDIPVKILGRVIELRAKF